MVTASLRSSVIMAAIVSHSLLFCRTWTLPYAILPSGSTCHRFDKIRAFHQIPLSRDSKKYSTLVTPFWGVQVYARSAVSTPGSETALKELACRVLVHITRIADDLYCRENSPRKLPQNWRKELQALMHKCNLRLSPSKTIINPHSTTVVG